MAQYKLKHKKSGTWVDAIDFDMDYSENHAGEIVNIETLGFESCEEKAWVFTDKSFQVHCWEKSLDYWYEKFGLERVYQSESAYRYYSNDLKAWMTDMGNFTLDMKCYPSFAFRDVGESGAMVVRDADRIEWLEKNTNLIRREVV